MSLLPTPTYTRTYISRSCVCFCDASHTGTSCELDASTPTCPLYSPSNPGGLLPGLEHYTSLSEQGQLWFNLEAGRKLCEAEVSFAHGAGELFSSPCLLSSPKSRLFSSPSLLSSARELVTSLCLPSSTSQLFSLPCLPSRAKGQLFSSPCLLSIAKNQLASSPCLPSGAGQLSYTHTQPRVFLPAVIQRLVIGWSLDPFSFFSFAPDLFVAFYALHLHHAPCLATHMASPVEPVPQRRHFLLRR